MYVCMSVCMGVSVCMYVCICMCVCIVYVCVYECVSLSSALSSARFSAACTELCWEVGKHFSLQPQGDVSEGERFYEGCSEGGRKATNKTNAHCGLCPASASFPSLHPRHQHPPQQMFLHDRTQLFFSQNAPTLSPKGGLPNKPLVTHQP